MAFCLSQTRINKLFIERCLIVASHFGCSNKSKLRALLCKCQQRRFFFPTNGCQSQFLNTFTMFVLKCVVMIQRILFHDAFRCSNLVKQAPRTQNCVSIELKQLVQDMNFNWQLFWEIYSVFSVRKHLHIPWSIFCTLHPLCFKQVTALFIKKKQIYFTHSSIYFSYFYCIFSIYINNCF